jgi:hypothetical protein
MQHKFLFALVLVKWSEVSALLHFISSFYTILVNKAKLN